MRATGESQEVAISLHSFPVAIVTGAGRGIGRATALALAAAGWKVALVARSAGDLEQVAAQVRDAGGVASPFPADVADWEAVRDLVARVSRELGPPSGLVNNAAVVGPVGPAVSVDPQAWKETVDVNLTGVFHLVRAAVAAMREQGRGTVLNLVSGMGLRVFPRFSAYSVSKAGLIHLTRILAEELKPCGITVNALDPGLVDTRMHEILGRMPAEQVGPEMFQRLRGFRERQLFRPPESIGKWIAAFFSGRAWEITGEVGTLSEFESRHGIPPKLP